MANVQLTTSHYLHESKRIIPTDKHVPWKDHDADYNIREGLTFGESETETLSKQGWHGAD